MIFRCYIMQEKGKVFYQGVVVWPGGRFFAMNVDIEKVREEMRAEVARINRDFVKVEEWWQN